jgi:hypothetical protein
MAVRNMSVRDYEALTDQQKIDRLWDLNEKLDTELCRFAKAYTEMPEGQTRDWVVRSFGEAGAKALSDIAANGDRWRRFGLVRIPLCWHAYRKLGIEVPGFLRQVQATPQPEPATPQPTPNERG